MAKISEDELQEIISAINIFDTVGDGTLPIEKIVDCLRSLGLNPLSSEADKIVDDTSKKGSRTMIEIEEFLPIYEYFQCRKKPTFEELCEGIATLSQTDSNMGKTVSIKELEVPLTCIGDKLTRKECNSLLSRVKNANNDIDIETLVRLVMGDQNASDKDIPRTSSSKSNSGRHARRSSGGTHQILSKIKESSNDH